MSPSYQILSHFRHCWPNKKPCSQGATTTYLRRSEPEPRRVAVCAHPAQAPQVFPGPILGGVVDDHQLEVVAVLRERGGDRLAQHADAVVGRYDDAQQHTREFT